jgi:hypothetical protein
MTHWLYIHFGINGTGPWYGFWSGTGSDIGEVAIVGAIWRMLNCHEPGCWRPGHHIDGHIVCRKHRRKVA